MAYTRTIKQNTPDSHQTSPGYMLTFIRWTNRDTFNYAGDNLSSRAPLVVINDAIQVTVSNSKTGITPSLTAILKAGDLNYATAIAPGDFVFCNMKNWASDVYDGNEGQKLFGRAISGQQINRYRDGFKGVFKVQTVRKTIVVDPTTGAKTLGYRLHAFGFTEFNTNIYYDPLVFNAFQGNYKLFNAQFNSFWSEIVSGKSDFSIQRIMQLLIQTLIGYGTKQLNGKLPNPANKHFRVPPVVGSLLGVHTAKYAYEIYNFMFGVWQTGPNTATSPGVGFNPMVSQEENPSFYRTPIELDGRRILAAEFWNNVKVWNIIQSYLNGVVNEMYTTYRVNINNVVMPTVVIRQKTFTSQHFRKGKELGQSKSKVATTTRKEISRHLEMPRWKIAPEMITDINLGRDEASRINFVQIYTRTLSANDQKNRAMQTGQGNYVVDVDDIERHGLKPYIVTAQFDFPDNGKVNQPNKGAEWAQLVGDFLIGGHLREAGTVQCIGIEEPISVGDKLQLGSVVYEIEGVTDVMSVGPDGKKLFRTNLQLSFGMDIRSDKNRPVYPEMEHTDSYTLRVEDFNSNQAILPGSGEAQDIAGRLNGEEVTETKEGSFTLNPKKQDVVNPANRETLFGEDGSGDLSGKKRGDS